MQCVIALTDHCRKHLQLKLKLALWIPTALVAEGHYKVGELKLPPVTQRVSTAGGRISLGELLKPPLVSKPVEFWLQPSVFDTNNVEGKEIKLQAPFWLILPTDVEKDVNMEIIWEEVEITVKSNAGKIAKKLSFPIFVNTKALKVGDTLKHFQAR